MQQQIREEATIMSKSKTITVLVKEPLKNAEIREISDTLETKQAIVGGYLESFSLNDKYVIFMNEDGKRLGLQPNLVFLPHNILLGTIFISRIDWKEGVEIGLTQEEIEEVTKLVSNYAIKQEFEANHYVKQMKKFM